MVAGPIICEEIWKMAVGFGIQSLNIAEQVRKTLFNEHKADQLLCLLLSQAKSMRKVFPLGMVTLFCFHMLLCIFLFLKHFLFHL